MSAHFARAVILFQQGRYDLAETELRQTLAEDPQNAPAHAMLGLCIAQPEDFAEASREAAVAISLAPNDPHGHYVAATIFCERSRLPEAEAAIKEAIRLEPDDA